VRKAGRGEEKKWRSTAATLPSGGCFCISLFLPLIMTTESHDLYHPHLCDTTPYDADPSEYPNAPDRQTILLHHYALMFRSQVRSATQATLLVGGLVAHALESEDLFGKTVVFTVDGTIRTSNGEVLRVLDGLEKAA
jgi:hypothetical protein